MVDTNHKFRGEITKFFLFVMFIGGGVTGLFFVAHIFLYFIGGMELINQVWLSTEPVYIKDHLLLLWVGVVIGGGGGAWVGVRLGVALLRKLRLVSEAQIDQLF